MGVRHYGFLLGFALLMTNCADSSTLNLNFSVAQGSAQPSFAVVISLDPSGTQYSENISLTKCGLPNGPFFYSDPPSYPEALKKCSVETQQVANSSTYITTAPAPAAGPSGNCQQLKKYWNQTIFSACANPKPDTDPLSQDAFTLINSSNGYVFVLFFFAGIDGYQIYASQIKDGKLLNDPSNPGGNPSASATFTVDSTKIINPAP